MNRQEAIDKLHASGFGPEADPLLDAWIDYRGEASVPDVLDIAAAIVRLTHADRPEETIHITLLAEAMQMESRDNLRSLATTGYFLKDAALGIKDGDDGGCHAAAVRALAILRTLDGETVSYREIMDEYDYRNGKKLLIRTDGGVNDWLARHRRKTDEPTDHNQ